MNRYHITESALRAKKQRRIRQIHSAYVTLLNELPDHIDLDAALTKLQKVPSWIFDTIDGIYIGTSNLFKEKDIAATFVDGAIYVTSELETTQDLYDNILHELAHAVEAGYPNELFGDHSIQEEFLQKRDYVYKLLVDYSISPKFSYEEWQETEFNPEFDVYLADELTYERLDNLAGGFLSYPYALTDVHEYVATAFAIWFSESPEKATRFHPAVAKKIEELSFKGDHHD